MKTSTEDMLGTLAEEREGLQAERGRRVKQRQTAAAELSRTESLRTKLAERREQLRVPALVDRDAAAAAELEDVTREAAGLTVRAEDLRAAIVELDTRVAKVDVGIRSNTYRSGLAELRVSHGDVLSTAAGVDRAIEDLVRAVAAYNGVGVAMQRRAVSLGLATVKNPLHDIFGALAATIARVGPGTIFENVVTPAFRRPCAAQAADWPREMFADREPPAEWRASSTPATSTDESAAA